MTNFVIVPRWLCVCIFRAVRFHILIRILLVRPRGFLVIRIILNYITYTCRAMIFSLGITDFSAQNCYSL